MMTRAIARGFSAVLGRPALVFTTWAWNLALAWLAALPAASWWAGGFDLHPSSDWLLDGFSMVPLVELSHYDRTFAPDLVQASMLGMVLIGLVTGPLVAGGVLEVLTVGDGRPFLHRFFRGAGHFYGRFLRLTLVGGLAGVLVAGLVAAGLAVALQPLADSTWEPGWIVALAVQGIVIGLVALFFLLALDYARIQVALDDSRKMLRAWLAGLRFVMRRFGGVLAVALVFVAGVLALLGIYLAFASMGRFASSGAILLLVVVQQAVVLVRAGLRVGWLDAEVGYFIAARPPVAAAEVSLVAPWVAEPADEAPGRDETRQE